MEQARKRRSDSRGHRGAARLARTTLHNNYQDFQAFLDNGGKIGLQHDPLLYGAYLLNPFLVRVEMVPMLVVNQGEVAVIKAYVGLPTLDTSGAEFKFGSIVRPGHRGIWQEPLRTGKYPINPRCYAAEIVPTSILTLNWSEAVSTAHNLDAHLSPIEAKSREGFVFTHRPAGADPRARHAGAEGHLDGRHDAEPRQRGAAGGGRQPLPQHAAEPARRCASSRPARRCRRARSSAITAYLAAYDVETRGVYIQDVHFPDELVEVLTKREIANQEKATYEEQERARDRAHRDGEGEGHRRHAGPARAVGRSASRSRTTRPQAREAQARVRPRTSS